MTEPQPNAPATDLGVVDPIRIPGAGRASRLWSGLPLLGQVFVALVAADIVIRALGLFGTSLSIDLGVPFTWLTAFLPHDAMILLPAVILYRRPAVATELPLLVRGAITVALAELLRDPVRGLLAVFGDNLVLLILPGVAAVIATGLGWAAMARDMEVVTRANPWNSSALLANLVGGTLAVAAVLGVAAAVGGNVDLGDGLSDLVVRITNGAAALSGLGLAYLAWVLVRGTDDPARPVIATRLASASIAALAGGTFLSLVASVLATPDSNFVWFLIFVATYVGGYTGLVAAFGLGLADPSGTIEHAVPTDDRATEQSAPA